MRSREDHRDTATAAGAASINASTVVNAPTWRLFHVASSHPGAVKYFSYHCHENPGGGKTKKAAELNDSERVVMDAVATIMRAVDEGFDEAYLDGVLQVLRQPEFSDSDRAIGLLELLDERNVVRALPLRSLAGQGVTVIIGAENPRLVEAGEAIRACSVVVGAYGAPGLASGALAVLGPMRMRYSRTIPTVRYL